MMERTLLVLGAGGHGKAVAEAALLSGHWTKVLFLDDAWPQLQRSLGCEVIGTVADIGRCSGLCQGAIAAVGNNKVREAWCLLIEQAAIPLASVVHSHAWVSPHATLGAGSAVMAGAVVGTGAVVGRAAIINANATVDHDAVLGDYAHLGVGVQLAGGVQIGGRAWLQAGSSAGYRVVVPDEAVFGPGTVLEA